MRRVRGELEASQRWQQVSEENWQHFQGKSQSTHFREDSQKNVFSLFFTSPTIFRNIPPSTRNILIKSCILFESLPIVFVLKLGRQTAARRLKKKVQAFLNTDSSFVYTSNLKLETITRQDSTITTTPIGHGMEFADKNPKS